MKPDFLYYSTMQQLKKVFQWFVSGLIILLPLGATLILIGWVLNFLNGLVGGQSIFAALWRAIFGWLNLGNTASLILGYVLMLAVIIAVGYFAQGYAKQRIGNMLRNFFNRIPIVNKIYQSAEQLIDLWAKKKDGEEQAAVGEVVMVQFANVQVFGVLSSRTVYKMNGDDYYLVYMPSAPVPATGFTYFFKTSDVYSCGLKMDDMTKVVVSLGVLGQEVLGSEIPMIPVEKAKAPVSEMPAPASEMAALARGEKLEKPAAEAPKKENEPDEKPSQ